MITFENYKPERVAESLEEGDFFVTPNREALYRVDRRDSGRKRIICNIIHKNSATTTVSAWPFNQLVIKVVIKEVKVKEVR